MMQKFRQIVSGTIRIHRCQPFLSKWRKVRRTRRHFAPTLSSIENDFGKICMLLLSWDRLRRNRKTWKFDVIVFARFFSWNCHGLFGAYLYGKIIFQCKFYWRFVRVKLVISCAQSLKWFVLPFIVKSVLTSV